MRRPDHEDETFHQTINVFGGADPEIHRKLDELLTLASQQGATVSDLSDAVDALLVRVNEDVNHLLDLLAASQAAEAAALANDAADAQTIAERTAERDAALADAQATVARINAIDPLGDFPPVEPPA